MIDMLENLLIEGGEITEFILIVIAMFIVNLGTFARKEDKREEDGEEK